MPDKVLCPACGQADRTEKVSTIYLVGSERKESPSNGASLVSQACPWLQELSPTERWALSRRLAPPSSGKQAPTRPLHPDLVVFTFSLALPVFVYGILNSQPVMLFPMLAFVAGVYGIYLWKREAIVARFASKQAVQQAADERAKQAIARWMQLYYCVQDDGVFISGDVHITPADQMPGYLLNPPPRPGDQDAWA
jgi:hypothetical protein